MPENIGIVEEIRHSENERCKAGDYGVENIEIVKSDGDEVEFKLKHGFCDKMDRTQIWFDNPGHEFPSLCYDYSNTPCNQEIGTFTAKCHYGWATVNVIGEKGSSFRQETEIKTPVCQKGFNFVDFNAQKRCSWQLRIPCVCDRRNLNEIDVVQKTAENDVIHKEFDILNKFETECESKSKKHDVLPVPVDSCSVIDFESPIQIIDQGGDAVRFSVNQVWKGCSRTSHNDKLGWLAADYVGLDDELHCTKFSDLHCGLASEITAKCNDGATVVDLFTFEPSLFSQGDGSGVIVPDACEVAGNTKHMCHFRYILKCSPSLCASDRPAARRLGGK